MGRIIKRIWETHHVGLVEGVIVTSDDPALTNCIIGVAQQLPRYIIRTNNSGRLILHAALPLGGASGLASALATLSVQPEVRTLGNMVYGSWSLRRHISHWDIRRRKWIPHRSGLTAWTRNLRDHL